MKKLFFFISFAANAYALAATPMVNDTSEAIPNKNAVHTNNSFIKVGYLGDFVLQRKMYSYPMRGQEKITSTWKRSFQGIEVAIPLNNSVNFVGRFGHVTLSGKTHRKIDALRSQTLHIQTNPGVSYGLGICATIYELSNAKFTANAFYSQEQSKIKRVQIYREGQLRSDVDMSARNSKLYAESFVVGLNTSYKLGNVAPYLGVQYVSQIIRNRIGNPPNILIRNNTKNATPVGAILGISSVNCGRASFNLEGRFISEQALSLKAQFEF